MTDDRTDQQQDEEPQEPKPIAKFCREHGCPCADDCPNGCYLLEE
jgi:hypothetical protein